MASLFTPRVHEVPTLHSPRERESSSVVLAIRDAVACRLSTSFERYSLRNTGGDK